MTLNQILSQSHLMLKTGYFVVSLFLSLASTATLAEGTVIINDIQNNKPFEAFNKLVAPVKRVKVFNSNAVSFNYPAKIKTRKNPVSFESATVSGANNIAFATIPNEDIRDFESQLREYLTIENAIIAIDCEGAQGECGFYTPREFIRTTSRKELFEQYSQVFNLNQHDYKIISASIKDDQSALKALINAFIIGHDNNNRESQLILDWSISSDDIVTANEPFVQIGRGSLTPKKISQIKEHNVYFDLNSIEPNSAQTSTIKLIAQSIKNTPNSSFSIIGHTDNTGNVGYNAELALRRAQSLANILVKEFNISKEKLNIEAKGSSSPQVANTSAPLRALNRRVEVIKLETAQITHLINGNK